MSVFLFLFLLLASQHSLQDLSSPTKDRILPSAVRVQSPNHPRTTTEFPVGHFLSLVDAPEA